MLLQNLGGTWQFRSERLPDWHAAQVPGCVHSDLLRLNLIPDPNWRKNEADLQWIGQVDWTYRREFSVDDALLNQTHVVLRAEGLDTLATIRLNGREVARADNMHRTWEWDVKPFLRAGGNEIEILFASPFPYLKEKGKTHPLEAWNEYYEIRHRGWLRKEHSNFGWDWNPVLVSCGIWRGLSLVAWSDARLLDVLVQQTHEEGSVHLTATANLSEDLPNGSLEMEIVFEGAPISKTTAPLASSSSISAAVPNPQLWWPAGMGQQPRYEIRVRLLDASGNEVDSWQRKIGLRTLRLVRKADAHGETFQFEANGVPFFAKGSNWSPPLPYPEWPAEERWKRLLNDAVAVHHNMIRMWGGAYFCPDEFFEHCDEIGLTIWQDFLYACGPYPAFDEAFMRNIEAEARDNVRRLRHHPCMAIWCGNNELEGPFTAEAWTNMKMSFADYDSIFNGVLKVAVEELDPQGNYWPASPVCTGKNRAEVSDRAGDIHIWEIWFGDSPFENYRNYPHRFISEFGFQSMPHLKTIESFTLPEDRQLNSPVMEFHQRSAPGNQQQLKALMTWYRFPLAFADQLALSQLVQANCVKIGVEHWRRLMPRTMGTLYWQLSDSWPCPSWSSIDFAGRWKALHYFSARFFAPVLISGLEDSTKGTVEVHLSNDQARAVQGIARWKMVNLGGAILSEGARAASCPGLTNVLLTTITLEQIKPRPEVNEVLLWLEFLSDDGVRSTNLVLLDRPKKLELRDPGLTFEIHSATDNSFEIFISARQPAPWVWIECEGFDLRLSNNFFAVLPGEIVRVEARASRTISVEQLRAGLRLCDVRGTYVANGGGRS